MLEMKVRLTFVEPLLGASPSNPDIYSTYISSKSEEGQENKKEELAAIAKAAKISDADAVGKTPEEILKGIEDGEVEIKDMTVFPRLDDGTPFIYDYQIKGQFKNACSILKKVPKSESSKIKAFKKDIVGLVFINERRIPINYDGEIGTFQRPLRASTMQGERIALACSEKINEGATCEFTIRVLVDDMMMAVIEWLDYGRDNGLLQFHNGGYGRFTWEDITEYPEA